MLQLCRHVPGKPLAVTDGSSRIRPEMSYKPLISKEEEFMLTSCRRSLKGTLALSEYIEKAREILRRLGSESNMLEISLVKRMVDGLCNKTLPQLRFKPCKRQRTKARNVHSKIQLALCPISLFEKLKRVTSPDQQSQMNEPVSQAVHQPAHATSP